MTWLTEKGLRLCICVKLHASGAYCTINAVFCYYQPVWAGQSVLNGSRQHVIIMRPDVNDQAGVLSRWMGSKKIVPKASLLFYWVSSTFRTIFETLWNDWYNRKRRQYHKWGRSSSVWPADSALGSGCTKEVWATLAKALAERLTC